MSDNENTARARFDFAQRELRRPVPLTLAIAAVIGWLGVIGLGWMLMSQGAEYRQEIAQLEQTQGAMETVRARLAAAKIDLDKLEKARAEAQAAVDAGQKQQAAIKTNVDDLTRNRETLTQEISRVEQSLADLSRQSATRTKELTEAQQGLQGARERIADIQKQLADQRAELDKATRERTAAEQQTQAARQELEKLRAEAQQGQNIAPAAR